ncbi:MAG: serine/threonine-protein kinase [Acidobacteriota bacterium]
MKHCIDCKKQYPGNVTTCPDDGFPVVESDADKSDPMVGKTILDKYRIIKILGHGGMGSVYEGRHLQLDRQVAIKVMQADIASDEQAVARFIREAKTSAKLDHTNAVTIHDFGILEDGGAFIVMEFINGHSLRKILLTRGALPLEQALEWFMQICSAVDAAHRRSIVHRDLKPENIMLKETEDGLVIKVVDFGLAKLSSSETGNSIKLTKTGEIMGTPQYMAPELFDGETADSSTDIYALGIIFYEMITGVAPFSGSLENVIKGHLLDTPKPVARINPTIKVNLDDVINLAMKKRRAERISSAMEFVAALKSATGFSGQVNQRLIQHADTSKLPLLAEKQKTNTPTVKEYKNFDKQIPNQFVRPTVSIPTDSYSTEQFHLSVPTSQMAVEAQQTIASDKPTTIVDSAALPVSSQLPITPSTAPTAAVIQPSIEYETLKSTVPVLIPTNAQQTEAKLPVSRQWLAASLIGLLLLAGLVTYFVFQSSGTKPATLNQSSVEVPKVILTPNPNNEVTTSSEPSPHSNQSAGKQHSSVDNPIPANSSTQETDIVAPLPDNPQTSRAKRVESAIKEGTEVGHTVPDLFKKPKDGDRNKEGEFDRERRKKEEEWLREQQKKEEEWQRERQKKEEEKRREREKRDKELQKGRD